MEEQSQESSSGGSFALFITFKLTGEVREASLSCSFAGESDLDPARACQQLRAADGHIERIPPASGVCTAEVNPVILRASGTWNGAPRDFEKEFSNLCVGVRDTGGVIFDF
ncbi:MAG: SSI family serine proteinase inhibitor [Actinomycetota bacterium]